MAYGSGALAPAPGASTSAAPTLSAPSAGPSPPAKALADAVDDMHDLQFQAEGLYEQVLKLGAARGADTSAPPAPPRGRTTRQELEAYVATMSKEREALLYDDRMVQERSAPPPQYKRNLPSAN
jgi:hypothetical protein